MLATSVAGNVIRPAICLLMRRAIAIAVFLSLIGAHGRPAAAQGEPSPETASAATAASADSNIPSGRLSFTADVAPIFKQHCLSCHGPDKQEGDLRLDRHEFVLKGGHTGSPLLTVNLAKNALLQRVTTDDESIRMPKNASPLSESDVATLRRWIELGAVWEDSAFQAPATRSLPSPPMKLAFSLDSLPGWNPFNWSDAHLREAARWSRWFAPPLLALLVLIVLCERSRIWVRDERRWTQGKRGAIFRGLSRVPKLVYPLSVLLVLVVFCGTYYQVHATDADLKVDMLQKRIASLEHQLNPPSPSVAKTPRPIRPHHPPRLGGEYYRGNDERNPSLFNGGFYLTATMRLSLCRADRSPLSTGDELDSPHCLIRLEIEQAPGATPALFAQSIWDSTFVCNVPPGTSIDDPERQVATFRETQPGTWEMFFPVDVPLDSSEPVSGVLYICRGTVPGSMANGEPHYAAEYSLSVRDGRITPESELWMGYVFRTGNVMPLPMGKIPEDEWFSFRAMPKIPKGGESHDPKLLGIPEHFPDSSKPSPQPENTAPQ